MHTDCLTEVGVQRLKRVDTVQTKISSVDFLQPCHLEATSKVSQLRRKNLSQASRLKQRARISLACEQKNLRMKSTGEENCH